MFRRRRIAWTCLTAAAGLLTAGCQLPPRVVIQDLPVDKIAEAAPAAPQETPRSQPRTRAAARADAAKAWAPRKAFARPWRWIVIHHSATDTGSAAAFDRMHRAKGWDELGYHFVINNGRGRGDGTVEAGSRWVKQKWGAHCKTPDNAYNDFGIGICVVGHYTAALPSQAQLRSLLKLVTFLSARYNIDPGRVIGHRDAPGTKTQCPGDALRRYVHTTFRAQLLSRQRLASQ